MPRPEQINKNALQQLREAFESPRDLAERLALVLAIRESNERDGDELDRFFLTELERRQLAIAEFRKEREKLRELLAQMTAPPWHLATFRERVDNTASGTRAIVVHGGADRLVGAADGVSLESFRKGDGVFLSRELNAIMGRAENFGVRGETGFFDRRLADGRLVLKWRDEEIIVDSAAALGGTELKTGDLLRFERDAGLAFERIEQASNDRFFIKKAPDVSREQIGGLCKEFDTLLSALTAGLLAPEKAARYGFRRRQSILLIGHSGCGKTLMAKAAASELQRISGRPTRFAVVKPAEWESPWVGQTQENIRRFFEVLATAAEDGQAVAFFDEIESIGRTRGSVVGHHSDKFLAALLAELDGFKERKNVAIIAAGNRKDLIDSALLERISDIEIQVRRPDLRAARHIFKIHLPETLPFHPNGAAADGTREELIDTAVSRLYSPNGENQVCVIRFRDGKARTVAARELVSGRIFEQVCQIAKRRALRREMAGGEQGIRLVDIDEGVTEAIQRLRTMLTIKNAHSYLSDLPQDVEIVSVEPIVRKVGRPARYLNLGT
jgi:proteasome ATPase